MSRSKIATTIAALRMRCLLWLTVQTMSEVLITYQGRKRPVQLPALKEENEPTNLLNLVTAAFNDVISCQEGSSSHPLEEPRFYLQIESKKWGGQLIEVSKDSSSISDGSVLHLCRGATCMSNYFTGSYMHALIGASLSEPHTGESFKTWSCSLACKGRSSSLLLKTGNTNQIVLFICYGVCCGVTMGSGKLRNG